ncbi:hypothetical protein F4692_002902 [Nocardioides cavernae]|uniref:Uncharacterized protein n=1 Tax=Nocardioides cavernae TaxID=1921566 RepID=A0A7Y9KSN8_9ACTN|nr:hypothetical protein [Nocardioides cavernae]NYE37769.1 hypothetical protein [Nocardioides cavernae]
MIRPAALVLAVGLTWSGLSAASAPAGSTSFVATATEQATGSSVRVVRGRKLVVTTQVRGRAVRGTGRVPRGLSTTGITARPARDALGSGAPEVLVDFGPVPGDPSAHAYGFFTLHRGALRPVLLGRDPAVLVTATEGGDDVGFRCAGRRLQVHWFHRGSGQGERTAYRLTGTRLVEESRTPLRQPTRGGPATCG